MSLSLLLLFAIAILLSLSTTTNAYVFSDKTIAFGWESITTDAVWLFDDVLIAAVNVQFPTLLIPLGSLTFNASLYRLSQGLRPPRTEPIGFETGFFLDSGVLIVCHTIFDQSVRSPGGNLVSTFGADVSQPYQIFPFEFGTGILTTNEGVVATIALTGMGDVVVNDGVFEKFSNGHVRLNTMGNFTDITNGTAFQFEGLYLYKFDSNHNLYWWDSYVAPWW